MAQQSNRAQHPNRAMASLNASLLAPKGGAQPAAAAPALIPVEADRFSARRHAPFQNQEPTAKTAAEQRPTPVPGNGTSRSAAKAGTKKKVRRQTKKKSLRLSTAMDKDLRLLAVRNGQSQQALLQQAVSDYLEKAFASGECMCRRE